MPAPPFLLVSGGLCRRHAGARERQALDRSAVIPSIEHTSDAGRYLWISAGVVLCQTLLLCVPPEDSSERRSRLAGRLLVLSDVPSDTSSS